MRNAIFISYRRNDSQGMAGRIYDYLLKHFSKENLFFDVDNIAPGENFETSVVKAVEQCHTMLVIMGPDWLKEITAAHTSDRKDWVELEISTALNQNLRIIPLLLEDTRMPAQTELPESLQPLSLRNALSVRHLSFSANMQTLISTLKEPSIPKKEKPAPKSINKKWLFIAAGIIIAVGLFYIGSVVFKKKNETRAIEDFLTNELNKADSKQLGAWDGMSGALEVRKTEKLLFEISASNTNSNDRKTESRLNDLSYKGIISVKIIRDEYNGNLHSKDLEISLTDKGKKYLIGETIDKYYLNAFDYDRVKVVSKKESGDTIYIGFTGGGITNKTPVYDVLAEEDKQRIDKDMATRVDGKLLRTKDGYSIVQEDSESNSPSSKEEDDKNIQTNPTPSADTSGQSTQYVLEGTATNATNYKTAGVNLTITMPGDNVYKCTGRFDEKTLFGRFELTGKKITSTDNPGATTLHFTGQINFGDNDGSNFDPGTTTTFTLSLVIFTDNATGTYIIDEIPNSSWADRKQNGLVTLKIKSRTPNK